MRTELQVHGPLSRGAFAVVVLVSLAVLFAPASDVPIAPAGVDKVVHGALFLALKTDGAVRVAARALARRWALVAAVPLLAWAGLVQLRSGTAVTGVLWLVAALAVLIAWARLRVGREGQAFAAWGTMLAAAAATVFGAAYPVVVPSTVDPAFDVTIADASVSDYTLTVMTWAAGIGLPVVLGYQAWTYWVFRKRLTAEAQHGEPAGAHA